MSNDPPVDLVVAGAGGGLVAALRAAQLGLSVLVVEANTRYPRGNNTAMSTAMLPAVGTRWQAEAGIDDTVELLVNDVMAKTDGQADKRLTHALAEVSAPLVTWLADDIGLPIELVTDFPYPGHSVHRCHTIPGRKGSQMLDRLTHRIQQEAAIDMLSPARLIDAAPGGHDVTVAVVEYPDGGREEIACRVVLLATSGYAANRELVEQHIPEIAGATYHGSPESRGDALTIGTRMGAATGYLDAYQGHAALAMPAASLVGWATIMHGGLLLNTRGHRFGDETAGYSDYAALLAAQPEATGWIVLDRRIHQACLGFQDFRETVESGALVWADSAEELAARTHLPPEAVSSTLSTAQACAQVQGADAFGRTRWEASLAPPYAAVRVYPALFHTQGGLVVDERARVLRQDDTPIPRLYASGGAAIGISGHGASGYLAGNGLLPAFGLAYLAAEDIAARDQTPHTRLDQAR